uniref:carnosine N-methyltransferase n=1 Tax=Haemonchus placei TaxID=6290 RepID=A0A0N4WAS9_HAEPC
LNAFLCYGNYPLLTKISYCNHTMITCATFSNASTTIKSMWFVYSGEVYENSLWNCRILKKIISYGLSVFGEEFATKTRRIRQKRRPEPHYMSKILSTLRQIVREWTVEGKAERDATYKPILDIVRERYSCISDRSTVKLMVPGSGLGRLAFELAKEGFTVEGNEYSMVMLMTSSFLLNACFEVIHCSFCWELRLAKVIIFEVEEHVIYPYALDKSNSWSYEDQTRPVRFPDLGKSRTEAPPNFSMIAGDFLEITQSRSSQFDCVVTAWFIDTAKNVIDYIETIYRILKPGGTWVNVGPLTYHYEDMIEEMSIELPYEEVMRIVRLTGFVVEKEERITSYYTINRLSMLQNQYTCAFFVANKSMHC